MTNGTDTSKAGPASRKGPPRLQAIALLINAAGAVLVVVLALLAVFGICLFLLGDVDSGDRGSVVTSAFTVIGTIVGTYTGVKIGSSGREEAEKARDVESAKVETLAARVDSTRWAEAMDEVPKRLDEWRTTGPGGWREYSETEARERPPGPSRPAP
jgi:hypothetical protein